MILMSLENDFFSKNVSYEMYIYKYNKLDTYPYTWNDIRDIH